MSRIRVRLGFKSVVTFVNAKHHTRDAQYYTQRIRKYVRPSEIGPVGIHGRRQFVFRRHQRFDLVNLVSKNPTRC